jgi:hypothetical protein
MQVSLKENTVYNVYDSEKQLLGTATYLGVIIDFNDDATAYFLFRTDEGYDVSWTKNTLLQYSLEENN